MTSTEIKEAAKPARPQPRSPLRALLLFFLILALLILVLASPAFAQNHAQIYKEGVEALYSLDFSASKARFRQLATMEPQDPANWNVQHLAFSVGEHDLERAMVALKEHGVPVRGPVHHEWMQATSVYFPDPDGHDLERCAPVGPVGRDERSAVYDRDSSSRTT